MNSKSGLGKIIATALGIGASALTGCGNIPDIESERWCGGYYVKAKWQADARLIAIYLDDERKGDWISAYDHGDDGWNRIEIKTKSEPMMESLSQLDELYACAVDPDVLTYRRSMRDGESTREYYLPETQTRVTVRHTHCPPYHMKWTKMESTSSDLPPAQVRVDFSEVKYPNNRIRAHDRDADLDFEEIYYYGGEDSPLSTKANMYSLSGLVWDCLASK